MDRKTSYTQSCVTGMSVSDSKTCYLDFEDSFHCYCNTDFCNTPNLFYTNFTILPTIECKKVYEKEYKAAACNKCTWKVSYIKYNNSIHPTNTIEQVSCGDSGESGMLNLDLTKPFHERISPNFYDDACYNITMNPEHYFLYCRCKTPNCNNPEGPLPFPIPPTTVGCYVSGYDADVNNAKYQTPDLSYWDNYNNLISNESYHDDGIQCRGHYCFIVPDLSERGDKYYKGCISLNEQGEQKIQLKMDKSMSPTNPKEEILCSRSGQSAAFSLDSTVQFIDRIGENFYDNSCYNISMHPDHYVLYCRCNTAICNDPTGSLPYPIPPPTISCYVSGYDAEVNNAKYDTPELSYNEVYSRLTRNESYFDEGINCRGHFCFIVNEQLPEGYRFYKGCMSSHEQGENKIQLGFNFVNNVPYYVCNTDFCNLNIVTALDEARNGTINNNNSSFKFSLALYLLIISMK
ncbi:hypothetical protein CAEBREN_10715 [Caenorhabditis brenneri]|uniref:DUF7622 domain-containing protein n=1 Tax=Caenorhabditis brenneri TaxID=135651 RepID=G0MSE2_CAEBE|nr:hypothetical protein CAEBREN_10715 [Caenorhabditis brenneri]